MSDSDEEPAVNQLVGSLSYDPDRGEVRLSSARYVMLAPSLFMELQKSVESHLPNEVGPMMTQAAHGEGAFLASRYRDVFGYAPADVLATVGHVLSEAGWGAVTTEIANFEGEELVVKVSHSAFAECYGPSTQSVCYTILGLLEGLAMALFDKPVDGSEVQCEAKGDSCCRFAVSGRAGY